MHHAFYAAWVFTQAFFLAPILFFCRLHCNCIDCSKIHFTAPDTSKSILHDSTSPTHRNTSQGNSKWERDTVYLTKRYIPFFVFLWNDFLFSLATHAWARISFPRALMDSSVFFFQALSFSTYYVNSFCHLSFSQIPLPIRGRSHRQLTSATRMKSAVSWTSTLRTPPWTKVRPGHFCGFLLQCHRGRTYARCLGKTELIHMHSRMYDHTCIFAPANKLFPWVHPWHLEVPTVLLHNLPCV